MDLIDKKIVETLMRQGRITWADLAGKLKLSAPSTADRVKRLEERGVILGYSASIDPVSIGCELSAFVAVTLEKPKHRTSFIEGVSKIAEIQECHHIAGDDDYLLKVRCKNTRDLDRVISEHIKSLVGVTKTRTTIVMNTVKETNVVPIKLID